MPFAIMRAEKLKSVGSLAAALQHCYRERETPNADPECTPGNRHLEAATSHEAMAFLKARWPEKRRKDAVLAVEYVMTASPSWWESATAEQQEAFFARSLAWLREKYDPRNVIVATIHHDELTPHLSAFVAPVTRDGRLSAKEFIGDRSKMRRDQTSYAACVADLGLERGIEGSKARHQRVRSHYGALERAESRSPALSAAEVTPQRVAPVGWFQWVMGAVESPPMLAHRLNGELRERSRGILDQALTATGLKRRVEQLEKVVRDQRSRIEQLEAPFRGLNRTQILKVLDLARGFQRENERGQERSLGRDRGPER